MSFIYKLTNLVNGKSYIGFTDRTIEIRWKEYLKYYKKKKYYIHRAMCKYGINNFKISLLEENESSVYTKNILEPKYIKQFNTLRPYGYNLTLGGEGNLGYKASNKTKKLNSIRQKELWKNKKYRKNQIYKSTLGKQTKTAHENFSRAALARWKNKEYRSELIIKFKKAHGTEAARKKMSLIKKKAYNDPYFIERQRNSACKFLYEVIFPNGSKEVVKSLRFFSKQHGLTPSAMYKVVRNELNSHKKFKVRKINLELKVHT